MFQPEAQYGQVAAMQELAREAPISRAPTPGAAAPAAPAVPAAPSPVAAAPVPQGTMVAPAPVALGGPVYYQRLADTWTALARRPGASEQVKAMAKAARQRIQVEERLAAETGR